MTDTSSFPTKILLATDGSEEAERASAIAINLAKTHHAELHVVFVEPALPMIDQFAEPGPEGTQPESRQLLDEQVRHIEEVGATIAETHLRLGRPDAQIVQVGEEIGADLIVLGSRGHGGVRRALMGSVSDGVVRYAHCPVLVVR
jgi:nucleotide-binding universal stress UspA family protein